MPELTSLTQYVMAAKCTVGEPRYPSLSRSHLQRKETKVVELHELK